MAMLLDIPASAEEDFRRLWGSQLDRKGLEALAIEAYRERHLSVGKLAEMLGFATSQQADQWLAEHGVALSYSAEDYAKDCDVIDQLRI
jgi:predicted HTH domain antitoxin